jgi:alpha-mannosidase
VLGVSLVRGPLYPDPFADEGEHHFTLSLFPHDGDWTEGGVVREAQALNAPLVVTQGAASQERDGFLTLGGQDLGFATLKRAHDTDGVVLRVYEPHGNRGSSTITFAKPVKSARRVNLLEEDDDAVSLSLDGNTVTLDVRPFELISVLVEFA